MLIIFFLKNRDLPHFKKSFAPFRREKKSVEMRGVIRKRGFGAKKGRTVRRELWGRY